jgi:hypothetical protein
MAVLCAVLVAMSLAIVMSIAYALVLRELQRINTNLEQFIKLVVEVTGLTRSQKPFGTSRIGSGSGCSMCCAASQPSPQTLKRRRLPHTQPGATSAEVVFQAVPRHNFGDEPRSPTSMNRKPPRLQRRSGLARTIGQAASIIG